MQNAIITLRGIQTSIQNETTSIEFVSEAKYYKKDNTYYIVYDETEITGMEGTKTTIKVSKDVVSLIRFGKISSNMTFELGVRHTSSYGTDFGFLDVATKANEIRISLSENGGEVYVDYEVEIDGERIGKNNFHLIIKTQQSDNNN
jgi:uncharacterized beta-barrel protein YwiB (DUF1934 family)